MGITTVILIKENARGAAAIDEYYLKPLAKEGITEESVILLPLMYNTASKVYAKTAKAYLNKLVTNFPATTKNIIIADSSYFKFITGAAKVSTHYGSTLPGKHPGYTQFTCTYVPNYKSLFKQPENAKLIELGIKAIAGTSASVRIDSAEFGFKYGSDRELLDSLYKYPVLAADIETTGLHITSTPVSISFAWSEHEGIAIDISVNGWYYTKKFLETYKGKLVFHGGLYDAKLLIRNWWMEHESDWGGMLEGLQYFKDFDDTLLMAYLAKNSTTHVGLGLKELALEYVGNYAIEIQDITKYTKKEILNYNLIDTLGTFYLYKKYQEQLTSRTYLEILQPSIYTLLKIMIVGLPLNHERVKEVNKIFNAKEKVLREQIQTNNCVISFTDILQKDACEKANAKLKKLVKPLSDFKDVEFNPGSHIQIAKLLFDTEKLPVLETTKAGAASTGGDVLEDLKNHTKNQDVLDLLVFLQELADITKINGTFISAFMKEKDFLHGSLKLGATQSSRLAGSDPNLTNLPAHGPMGKITKSCVEAPKNWLFAAADFDALEEKVGAILSKDPNRIKVYTDGFDGHSMRAQKYYADQMPDITEAIIKADTATEFWINDKGEYCCA